MEHLDLGPFSRASGTVRLPGSKSISNRVLLLAALAEGETTITNLLDSDDTRVMLEALEKLGVKLKREADECVVSGTRGAFTARTADLFLGNAGTAGRRIAAVQGHGLCGLPPARAVGDAGAGGRAAAPGEDCSVHGFVGA